MIKIICIGKIKEQFIKDGINEYLKRMSNFDKVEIIELKEITNKSINEIINLESELIKKEINPKDYTICLDIYGKMLDSVELSQLISDVYSYKASTISFIIGGSYGVNEELKKSCKYLLSFSKMTFPHQLMRLILAEQLYRAFTILNNQEYHK